MTQSLPGPTAAPPRPVPSRFRGLAWSALILGIVGLAGSPVIILNNVTAIAAGVGVVLGVIALFGSRRALAGFGVLLCVLGIVATVMVQAATVRALDEALSGGAKQGQVSDGQAGAANPGPATAAPPPAERPTWGKRHTWQGGLAVEVGKPVTCKPGRFAAPSTVERAVRFTITVVNGTGEAVETGLLRGLTDAQFDGRSAELIFDAEGGCRSGLDNGTILPGKSFTYEAAYAVGGKPGEMQLAFQPGFTAAKAVFVGPA